MSRGGMSRGGMSRGGMSRGGAAPGAPGAGTRARLVLWIGLVVAVAVALALGANVGHAPHTVKQRAAAIDALVRCPSCDGISVADSSASTAVAIRQAVAARLRAGQSDQQIDAFLVSRYGPGILLRPPVSGMTVWVWVLPPLALAAAVAVLGMVLWRRRRPALARVTGDDRVLVARALAARNGGGGTCQPVGGARIDGGRIDGGRISGGVTR